MCVYVEQPCQHMACADGRNVASTWFKPVVSISDPGSTPDPAANE